MPFRCSSITSTSSLCFRSSSVGFSNSKFSALSAGLLVLAEVEVVVALLDVFLDHGVHVEFLLGYILVEIRVLLVSHLLDDARHGALINLHLAVLESALQEFLGIESVLLLGFLQGEANLGLSLRGLHDVEPFSAWLLVALGEDFHLVARVQFLSEGDRLAVDLPPTQVLPMREWM